MAALRGVCPGTEDLFSQQVRLARRGRVPSTSAGYTVGAHIMAHTLYGMEGLHHTSWRPGGHQRGMNVSRTVWRGRGPGTRDPVCSPPCGPEWAPLVEFITQRIR